MLPGSRFGHLSAAVLKPIAPLWPADRRGEDAHVAHGRPPPTSSTAPSPLGTSDACSSTTVVAGRATGEHRRADDGEG